MNRKNTDFSLRQQQKKITAFALLFVLCALSPLPVYADKLPYKVVFEGVSDAAVLKILKGYSQLISLQDHPPASLPALQYRAESDIPELIKSLHALGYYDAIIQMRLEKLDEPTVIVHIELGVQYHIDFFEVTLVDPFSEEEEKACKPLNDESLHIHPGDPAYSSSIINAEDRLKTLLADSGFPLNKILERKIVVDGKSKGVQVFLQVEHGPFCKFGATSISGNSRVKSSYIEHKILWKEGEVFSQAEINATQKALLDSGLFTSVIITHEEGATAENTLPIRIVLTESKMRSISIGASYQTHWKAGGNLSWENRNVGGIGSKLHFEVDVTQRSQTGIASYYTPDFKRLGQDMVWLAQASNESVLPSYKSKAYSLLCRIDRKVTSHFSASLGLGGKRLLVGESVQNGTFWLAFSPFYLRYNTTDSLLNPSKGFKTHYHAKPTLNAQRDGIPYIYQEARLSTYWPLYKDRVILAQLFTLGSILSYKLSDVPVSERIFGGTEDNLRGYRFCSVSPLNNENKPIGGRGAFFYSLELRLRCTTNFGLVPFVDTGRVSRIPIPNIWGKWLTSAGLGVRYYTFFGPFRLDIGFPLDPRKGIDSNFRILASIGQTF